MRARKDTCSHHDSDHIAGRSLDLPHLHFSCIFSGIVNWHRKIVLGEKASRARFLPFGRDFYYAGHILWMTLVAFFYQKLTSTILQPMTSGSSADTAELISYILTPFLFAFFFKRLLLVLPSLSIENESFQLKDGLLAKATKGPAWPLSVGLLIVATEWIAEIPGVIYLLTLAPGYLYKSLNQYLIVIGLLPLLKILFLSYGAIVFATILSYFYRDNVRDDLLAYNQKLKDQQHSALAQ